MNVVEFARLISLNGSYKSLFVSIEAIRILENINNLYKNKTPEEILSILQSDVGTIPLLESQIKQLKEREPFLEEYFKHLEDGTTPKNA